MFKTLFTRVSLFIATNFAVILLAGLVMNLFGLDHALARHGVDYGSLLAVAAIFGFAGSFISLAMSKWIANFSTGAQVITRPRDEMEAWLLRTVEIQARAAGIDPPEVAIFPSADPNAFATGARRNHALVAVSQGLLTGMSRREVEAVLAHEISHVANGDMVTMALLQGVLNTFVFFLSRVVGMLIDGALGGRSEDRRGGGMGYFLGVMLSQIVLGLLASIIAMAYSRRREFRADAGSAALVGPDAMIGALRRLDQIHQPTALPQALAAFGIHGSAARFGRLFMSHPPIEERIAALQGRASQI